MRAGGWGKARGARIAGAVQAGSDPGRAFPEPPTPGSRGGGEPATASHVMGLGPGASLHARPAFGGRL
jgi:hypothetical protein